MANLTTQQREVIRRSQQSVSWFLSNFGRLKHPSAGVLPFHPFSYQTHAIKCFRQHRLNIFRKCRQCFAGESMVWTPVGPKRIDSVIAGDSVYSFNNKTGRLDIVQVEEVFDNGEMEVCEVVSKTGHRSVSTLGHNYFTYDGEVEAQNLTCNDRLIEVDDWPRIGVVANESEAILLGYMIADGYYGHGNSNQGHFTNTCWRYLLEYQKHFHKFFGVRRPIKPHNRDDDGKITSYRIYYSHKSFWDWVGSLGISGQTAEKKEIPNIVFSWDNDSVALFLNRLFAADGWYSGGNCNEVGIGQESVRMLHQIKQLLTRFNIDSKIYPATESSMDKLRIFGGKNFQLFVENIGIFNKEPRKEITKGFFFNRKKGEVKEVIRNGRIERVYDLKVPPHHNYVVDGAVVHNSGISKISGAFATWFAMFNPHKTVLIVSRRNEDAMGFLRDHVVFLYEHLPPWMKEVWKPVKQNEHEIIFPNGSRIQSLTSHPEVLRGNAASLNIIDEAAFIQGMDTMWAAGWPTLQHGGNVIVISTTNGIGNWYWSTWTDAEAGVNGFNPILVNWWDMDWEIEYKDPLSRNWKRIAPRDGIRKSADRHEVGKFGPYYSSWLEEQYNALQDQGDAWKFDQEILASFVGSGHTVLSKEVLAHVQTTVKEPEQRVAGGQSYVHPVTGIIDEMNFDFDDPDQGLWVWEKPVVATPVKKRGNLVVDQGTKAHSYVMGVDIATGKGRDFSAIEVFDVDTMEQVAEFMARCLPRELIKYIDRIGRWYNCALAVVERNNGGDTLIDSLRYDVMYPRIWRKKEINDKPTVGNSNTQRAMKVSQYGFSTSLASKPTLNKFMIDFISEEEGQGYKINSTRLLKQLQTYVRKRDRTGRDTNKTEAEDGAGNYDDLVIACALALVGTSDAFGTDAGNLLPVGGGGEFSSLAGPIILSDLSQVAQQKAFADAGGPSLMMPMTIAPDEVPEMSAQRHLDAYAMQLGGIPIGPGGPIVTPNKFFYERNSSK